MPPLTEITVGARSSPLSRIQVEEVLAELRRHHPHITFHTRFAETTGDRDKQTSLRTLDKTDFFTREIDAILLRGECRIAIHSAKDLPDPLPEGLVIAAMTRGLDTSDSLVISPDQTLENLPLHATIATSSKRREENTLQLRSDFTFVDIRGTIQERLAKLEKGEVDGVVIAEAALIRLGLTHLNRMTLPGETTPFQGRLAIVARKDDPSILTLFAPLHVHFRKQK